MQEADRDWLAASPIGPPADWIGRVNRAQTDHELEQLRRCAQRGQPYGSAAWQPRLVVRLGLQSSMRPRGRPRKDGKQ